MGEWKSERGVVSDHVADILGAAFKVIGSLEIESADPVSEPPGLRRYEMLDLADAIEFVTRGILTVEIREEAKELIKKMDVKDLGSRLFETIPNRGQIQDREEAEVSDQTEPALCQMFDFILDGSHKALEQAKSAPNDYTRDEMMKDAYKYLKIASEISYSSQEQKDRYKDIKADFWESAKEYDLIFDRDCLI